MDPEIVGKLQSLKPDELEVITCQICGNDTFIDHIRVVKPKYPIMHGIPTGIIMNQKAGSVCANPRCSAPYGITKEQFDQIQRDMLMQQFNSLSEEEKRQLPEEVQKMIAGINEPEITNNIKDEDDTEDKADSNIVKFPQFKKE